MGQGLQINCDFCGEPVTVPGGLLFTPVLDMPGLRKKEHLCVQCAARVSEVLDITKNGDGSGGIYVGSPLDTITWKVPWRLLNTEEVQRIKELFLRA